MAEIDRFYRPVFLNDQLRVQGATTLLGTVTMSSGRFEPRSGGVFTDPWLNSQTNTFLGMSAGSSALTHGADNEGWGNTAFGYRALMVTTTGDDNTAIGVNTLMSNTTGLDNTAVGADAMSFNTTGTLNTGCGESALHANTTGSNNTAVGQFAAYRNTTGGQNTALGREAYFEATTASNNTCVGYDAMRDTTTGGSNLALGAFALKFNQTGITNVAVGSSAGEGVALYTGSDNNVLIGYGAGANIGSNASGNIIIGSGVTLSAAGVDDEVNIGHVFVGNRTTGVFRISDKAAGGLGRVNLGGDTSAFGAIARDGAGVQVIAADGATGAFLSGVELAGDPAAPGANGFRLYAKDNGGGKTQLMVLFSSGAAQQVAIQP